MRFVSTRGGCAPHPAAAALLAGLAPDGGLFVPEHIVPIDVESHLADDWSTLALAVISPYLTGEGGLDEGDLAAAIRAAADRFESPDVAPVRLTGTPGRTTGFIELFHGPTHAFKDVALTLLPHLVTLARTAEGVAGTTLVLTATSGDTGKAALEGFRDVPGTEVVVLYPTEGVSFMQKQQMRTQAGDNVHVLGIHGDFDDAQRSIKALFADEEARARLAARGYSISSANSINLGRLLPQMVYYVSAYAQLRRAGVLEPGEVVDVVVPTGNFGNILAAAYVRAAGVPLGTLLCASNDNRVLTDFFETGTYDARRSLVRTTSPSMDILVSSNLERYLHAASGCDAGRVREAMDALARERCFDWGERPGAGALPVTAGSATATEAAAALQSVHERDGYLIDPHTAVAVHVLEQHRAAGGAARVSLVAATASPYKFAPAVMAALGQEAHEDEFETLTLLEAATAGASPVPAGLAGLRDAAVLHERVVEVGEVPAVIEGLLHA